MGLFDSVKVLIKPNASPASTQPQPAAQVQKKVLIVEDEPALRALYSEIISAEGYQVITAENGQVGLQQIQIYKPDLVLLDIMMPVMDGKTMLHTLRGMPEFAHLPVIVLTNAGDVETMRATKTFDNANDFLIKSNVVPAEIVAKVKSLLP